MFVEKQSKVVVIAKPEWALVGEAASDSLLVRGGLKPISIHVSHPSSFDLLQLLGDANAGIAVEKVTKPDHRAKDGTVPGLGLREIALQVQGWLDWDRAHRERHHLTTEDDTQIMALPVPSWPTHWQLRNWITELNTTADALDSALTR